MKNHLTSVLRRALALCLAVLLTAALLPASLAVARVLYSTRLQVTAPRAGAAPVYRAVDLDGRFTTTAKNTDGYHNGVLWRDVSASRNMSAGETFVDGHTYVVYVQLYGAGRYTLDEDAFVTINDSHAARAPGQDIEYAVSFRLLPSSGQTSPNGPTISAAAVRARVGGTVSVPLTLTGNTGIAGAVLTVTHDPALVLTGVTNGPALAGLEFSPSGDLSSGTVTLVWAGPSAVSGSGTLATLTFSVPRGTPEGDYNVALSAEYDGFFDNDYNDLDVQFLPGWVTVHTAEPGDLTGDGRLNAKDIVMLQRFLVGGHGVVLETAFADLNHDGAVNTKDVVVLLRAISGGYGITLTASQASVASGSGRYYYSNGNSLAFRAAVAPWHKFIDEKGETVTVPLAGGVTDVPKGYYRYSTDSEGLVTLTPMSGI